MFCVLFSVLIRMIGNFLFYFSFLHVLLLVSQKGNSLYGPYTCLFLCLFTLGYEKQTVRQHRNVCMEGQVGFFPVFFLLPISYNVQSTFGVLQLYACEYSEYKHCFNTLSDCQKICVPPMPEESLFSFHMGMLSFIFSSYWKMREIEEPLLSNASCSEVQT